MDPVWAPEPMGEAELERIYQAIIDLEALSYCDADQARAFNRRHRRARRG